MNVDLKSYFNVMSIAMLVVGILCCLTIFGAVMGVPFIIGANFMKKGMTMSDTELKQNNTNFLIWAIVFGALCSPVGLIAIVFAVFAYQKIENLNKDDEVVVENAKTEGMKENEVLKEKLETLTKMRDEGLLTEEEYQAERRKILGL